MANEGTSVVVEREKLYDEVWTDPVTTVAKRYGLSDVGLRKLCIRLSVPLPPRGHWARLRAGQQVKRVPLRPTTSATQERVTVKAPPGPEGDDGKPVRLAFLSEEERAVAMETCSSTLVKDRFIKPHPLVVQDREARQEQKRRDREDRRSLLPSWKRPTPRPITGFLDIRVPDAQLERTHKILDAVFYTIEKLGGTVKVGEATTVTLLKEPVKIQVKGKGELLTLAIDEYDAPRKAWNDTQRKKVESELGDFIIGIYEYAHLSRVKREEREREEARRRAEALRRQERAKAQGQELARYTALENAALDWQKARALEGYVGELERRALGESDPDKRAALLRQVGWAQAKVAWLDPLVAVEDPILGKRRHGEPEGQKVALEKPPLYW